MMAQKRLIGIAQCEKHCGPIDHEKKEVSLRACSRSVDNVVIMKAGSYITENIYASSLP